MAEYEAMKASRDQRIDQMERVVDLEEQLAHVRGRFEEIVRDRDEVQAALHEAREKLYALLGVQPSPESTTPDRPMYDR